MGRGRPRPALCQSNGVLRGRGVVPSAVARASRPCEPGQPPHGRDARATTDGFFDWKRWWGDYDSDRMHRHSARGCAGSIALKLGFLLLCLAGVSGCSTFHGRGIRYQLDHEYSVHDPQFLRAMDHLVGPPILASNRVSALINGDRIFPAMIEAIQGAQKSITLETYI